MHPKQAILKKYGRSGTWIFFYMCYFSKLGALAGPPTEFLLLLLRAKLGSDISKGKKYCRAQKLEVDIVKRKLVKRWSVRSSVSILYFNHKVFIKK
jgi:hypothetical protein